MRFAVRLSALTALLAIVATVLFVPVPAREATARDTKAPVDTTAAVGGLRVFVAGHSFHLPLVAPFDEIVKTEKIAGHKIVGVQGIGGSSVTQHWEKPEAQNTAKKAIATGTVDVLTLSPHLNVPDLAIDKFVDLELEHNPKGRVTVQASWLPHSPQIAFVLGFSDADRDKTDLTRLRKASEPWLKKIRDQAKSINDSHVEKYHRQVIFVVPTGEAVTRLRERIVKGEVPGIAKQSELFSDGMGHTKAPVGVLNAYCHYAVLYGKSPVGLPVPKTLMNAGLGKDNVERANRILQECAWEAVIAEPLSGAKAAGDR